MVSLDSAQASQLSCKAVVVQELLLVVLQEQGELREGNSERAQDSLLDLPVLLLDNGRFLLKLRVDQFVQL